MSWPDLVWRVDALKGVDSRARGEIEAAGSLVPMRTGDVVFATGDAADHLFVVVRGEVELKAVRRGDATSSVLRRAGPGEVFGEDGVVRVASVRRADAVCTSKGELARVPSSVLLRALTRVGASLEDDPHYRLLKRAALASALQGMAFARDLSPLDLGALVDASQARTFARGQRVFRVGEPAREAFFVADGGVEIVSLDGGRRRVVGYVGGGDFFGDEDTLAHATRGLEAIAAGPAWLVAVPQNALESLAVRHRSLLEAARRVRAATVDLRTDEKMTRHGLGEVFRLDVARSLLVIDQEQCVRCGHCSTSCENAHDDGVARLTRRGDKIEATMAGAPVSLILPSSCQHCAQPACMAPCPTGAIGRDANGDVFIRESLCTGCGACVKACPWDNVQLAGEPPVAVKCDLCAGSKSGPACVSGCPVGALSRIEPRVDIDELSAAPSRAGNRERWPLALGAGAGALATAVLLSRGGRQSSGIALAVLVLALSAYALAKRTRLVTKLSPHFQAHWVLGGLALAAFVAHVKVHVPLGVTGALWLAMAGALATGLVGLVLYALAPKALSRIEREGALPEDLPGQASSAEQTLLRELSGKSEGIKAIFARVLDPYRRSPMGWVPLLLSCKTLREERGRVQARIDALVGKPQQGIDPLVRACVDLRAIAARVWVERALRAWLPAHIAFVVVTVALGVVHVVTELLFR